MTNRVLGFVASVVAGTKNAVNGGAALVIDKALPAAGIAKGHTDVINDVDSTGGNAPLSTESKDSATVYVDRDGKERCITCGAVHHSPAGTLNGTVVVGDSEEVQSVLIGTAEVGDAFQGAPNRTTVAVDSAADAEPATLDGTAVAVDSAASALPGILQLNGTTVKFLDCDGITVPVVILSDGTAFVVDRNGNLVPVTLSDGTAFVKDSDAKGASTDTNGASTDTNGASGADGASYGAKAAKLCMIVAGSAVVGTVGFMAAPVGLAAGVGLGGFTGSGIAGGSCAAAWMSSIAVSNGVGVTAGSLFSVLQATGMGAGLMPAASAAGAGVGAVVGAAKGARLASWVSSKFGRTTTSSSEGCDPGSGSDVQEESKERCVTCGTPAAAATSLPGVLYCTSTGDLHPSPETSPGDHPWTKWDGSEKTNEELSDEEHT